MFLNTDTVLRSLMFLGVIAMATKKMEDSLVLSTWSFFHTETRHISQVSIQTCPNFLTNSVKMRKKKMRLYPRFSCQSNVCSSCRRRRATPTASSTTTWALRLTWREESGVQRLRLRCLTANMKLRANTRTTEGANIEPIRTKSRTLSLLTFRKLSSQLKQWFGFWAEW